MLFSAPHSAFAFGLPGLKEAAQADAIAPQTVFRRPLRAVWVTVDDALSGIVGNR
jgi:hypothetical protein